MNVFKHPILLDQALVSGGNFFLGVLLANFLPSDVFGKYVLLWLGIQFASSMQMALLVYPLYTNAPQLVSTSKERYISAISRQNSIFVLVAALVFIAYSQAVNMTTGGSFGLVNLMTAITGVLFLSQDLYRRILILRQDIRPLLLADTLAYIVPLLLLVAFSQAGHLTLVAALAIVAACFLSSLLYLVRRVRLKKVRSHYVKLLAFGNWQQSKYLFAASVLQLGGENIFSFTAGAILGPSATAVIRVLQNLMGGFHIIFVTIETNLAIRLAALKRERNTGESRAVLKRYLALGTLVFFLLFVFFSLFERDIFSLVYGEKYVSSSKYLKWFAINYCFIFFTIILKVVLRTAESSQTIFKSTSILVSINVLFAVVIVQSFGTNGAIAGLVLSNFIYAILLAVGTLRLKNA